MTIHTIQPSRRGPNGHPTAADSARPALVITSAYSYKANVIVHGGLFHCSNVRRRGHEWRLLPDRIFTQREVREVRWADAQGERIAA